jgi:hypothetical protein
MFLKNSFYVSPPIHAVSPQANSILPQPHRKAATKSPRRLNLVGPAYRVRSDHYTGREKTTLMRQCCARSRACGCAPCGAGTVAQRMRRLGRLHRRCRSQASVQFPLRHCHQLKTACPFSVRDRLVAPNIRTLKVKS